MREHVDIADLVATQGLRTTKGGGDTCLPRRACDSVMVGRNHGAVDLRHLVNDVAYPPYKRSAADLAQILERDTFGSSPSRNDGKNTAVCNHVFTGLGFSKAPAYRSVDLEPSPVLDHRLALLTPELVDRRVFVDGVVVVVSCGDFLDDAPRVGAELVPGAG
jgi:hypothetical protein